MTIILELLCLYLLVFHICQLVFWCVIYKYIHRGQSWKIIYIWCKWIISIFGLLALTHFGGFTLIYVVGMELRSFSHNSLYDINKMQFLSQIWQKSNTNYNIGIMLDLNECDSNKEFFTCHTILILCSNQHYITLL